MDIRQEYLILVTGQRLEVINSITVPSMSTNTSTEKIHFATSSKLLASSTGLQKNRLRMITITTITERAFNTLNTSGVNYTFD